MLGQNQAFKVRSDPTHKDTCDSIEALLAVQDTGDKVDDGYTLLNSWVRSPQVSIVREKDSESNRDHTHQGHDLLDLPISS